MLIALSGPQGSGKTTIVQKLHNIGYHTIQYQVARSILKDWNMTLDEVNSSVELTLKLQTEVIRRKYKTEKQAITDPNVWFTERSYIDIFGYAVIMISKSNAHSNWINDYYVECARYNTLSYSHVFYIRGGHFQAQEDGVRGINEHYNRMVDLTMLDIAKQMVLPGKLSVIKFASLDQRISFITNHVTGLQQDLLNINRK